MAYDPSHEAAANRFLNGISSLPYIPIIGRREYELKLAFDPFIRQGNIMPLFMNAELAVSRGRDKFYSLMQSFNCASNQDSIKFDPAGLFPNDYVLVSLGVDTVRGTLPTAEFFRNGWQNRVRFAIDAHHPEGTDLPPIKQCDANAKTLLSSHDSESHRIELETEVSHPSCFFAAFKAAKGINLPEFTSTITDSILRVSEICMTSRSGFFIEMKVPNKDAYILLHGVFDVSNYTTPSAEVYTRSIPRIEVEFEAKMMRGTEPNIYSEEGQQFLINLVFDEIRAHGLQNGMNQFTLSKLEDAAVAAQDFYKDRKPDISLFINHLNSQDFSHIRQGKIPDYLAYALVRGVSVGDVMRDIKEKGSQSPIALLSRGLPNPLTLLDNNLFQQHLKVA